MNMVPLVSVIMPAYNHETYIERAISSVASQTYSNVEIIVVDDGSTDSTAERAEIAKAKLDSQLARFELVVKKKNEGVQKTLNLGISKARGDFLLMLASDDFLESNAISALYDGYLDTPECGLLVGANYIVDENNKRCYWDRDLKNVYDPKVATYLSFSDYLQATRSYVTFNSDLFGSYNSYLQGNYMPAGFFVPIEVMRSINCYDEGDILEDLNLMLKISKKYKIRYINQYTYNYRWHSTNTAKQTEKMIRLTINTFEAEREYVLQNPTSYKLCTKSLISLRKNLLHGWLYKKLGKLVFWIYYRLIWRYIPLI